jgi:hypothetical protein
MTSIIQALRTYLLTCPSLSSGALVLVDHIGSLPVQYAVIATAGDTVVEQYLDGSVTRRFPFAFQSVEYTSDDLSRIENVGWFETFSDWLDAQTLAGNLPALTGKKTAEEIRATGQGYLYEEGQSETGQYQINCELIYTQTP